MSEGRKRPAPILARRVQSYLHRLFKWALGRGIIDANPASDLPKPGAETKRDRVLSDDELKAVWKACDKLGWPFGPAIQLLILTGARREEIGALRWSEIRVAQNEPPEVSRQSDAKIELTGDRTKNGQPHTIPLSKPALAIVKKLPRIATADKQNATMVDLVFTTTGKTPVSGWSKAKGELPEFDPHWRLHDLRRTVATGLQRLGTPLVVTEAVLGHVSGSRAGVVGVYQLHSYADEKRAALEAWGEHVMGIVRKGKRA